jgi:hypothetical protein
MSFLKQFGINVVSAVEHNHGQLEELLINDPITKPSSGYRANEKEKENFLDLVSCSAIVKRFIYFLKQGETHIYVDHPEEMIEMTTYKIDNDGDLVLKDFECPDCDEFGGCSHCERKHIDDEDVDLTQNTKYQKQCSDLFDLLSLQPPGPAYPGLYVVHDLNLVSVWTKSGVIQLPILAPFGVQEGNYFYK